jgi:glycosyltransferase involved in cell wall biosynthesis
MVKISVVINTLNEEKNLPRVLTSVKEFANEIIICDMHSDDKTVEIAKKFKAKVITHERTDYVEPARNFALRQASGGWILVLDADEELSVKLAEQLQKIVEENKGDYVVIPRKNIIFNQWMEHSRWWPDYLVRFFKNGKVIWSDKIHQPPDTSGKELMLEANEQNAIIHYNYDTIDQYLERMIRYSRIQSEQLLKDGYQFSWSDVIQKPTSEFLGRYFLGEGYKDGLHGFCLAFLQSLSEFLVYARIWESRHFGKVDGPSVLSEVKKATDEVDYWVAQKTNNPLRKILHKLR